MNTATHDTLSSTLVRARRPFNAVLRTGLVRALCTPRDIDDYLALLDSTWSVRDIRARIVAVRPEAGGATSLFLQPNENWRGFCAGQYVHMTVEIGGVRYARCFSISSAPEDGLPLRLTVRSLPEGRVATWAEQAAHAGDWVSLTPALGDFVLPRPTPAQLLFISGGSGITPIMSIVRHLIATGYTGPIPVLHYAREQAIFDTELTALARMHPQLSFYPILTNAARSSGSAAAHFGREQLQRIAPHWADCETFCCGPTALLTAATELFGQEGAARRLHVEQFVGPARLPVAEDTGPCRITFTRSGRTLAGSSALPLLEQAEGAGLRPPYGCRMGICHSCKCRKVSGVVRNELTGVLSGEPDEEIQLCISTPRSDVALEL